MLSIVLSFYNESDVIPELIARLRAVMDSLTVAGQINSYELIFINDASTDHSETLLKEMAEERGDIRVLSMSRNFGVSPCVLAGMEYASGEMLVYMDADLQDPPETIPLMLQAYKAENVDVVHTVRRSRSGETKTKLLITRLGYEILKRVSTISLQIEAGDFKLLSRRVVRQLLRLREKRPFLRGLVCWVGFKQTSIHYDREARFAGETKFPIFGSRVIVNFLSSALIAFSDIPLQFSSWFGALVSLSSVLFSMWIGVEWLRGESIPAWSVPLAILSLLSGVQLFSVGLLGLYIAAIHVESKRRPNFIVEKTLGFAFSPHPVPDSKAGP
jgi:glycosyltransferase involved in cell wall biosynthesis